MVKRGAIFVKKLVLPMAIILAALILWSGCNPVVPYQEPTPGVACRWDFTSSADGFNIPCTVYLPNGYDPDVAYPVWVELHALYGYPLVTNDTNNPFSNELKRLADERGWIILAPWGRSLHSMFADGITRDQEPYVEPDIFDDFTEGAGGWQPVGGDWAVVNWHYGQTDSSPGWKESICKNSTGENYAVRVRIRDNAPSGVETAVGVNLRRSGGGEFYHVDLYRDVNNAKYVRLYKVENGVWQEMYSLPFDWAPMNPLDGWIYLKFSCYEEYLEVYVNEELVNMQPGYDATPYGYGRDVPGQPLPEGGVSLCTYGGSYEFDDVRIQNEFEYGERDVLDCLLGAMEKYRIDPDRIYVAGHSQGGLGAYILGLRHPDMCAALRPADGMSDLYYDYNWWETYYPDNPGEPYADVNDGRLSMYTRMLAGGEPGVAYPERMSVLNGNSARYILENGVNQYWRIVHGTPDSEVPNSLNPVQICWWAPWWFTWGRADAPAPYNPATATYQNGKYIADKLQSWSSTNPYSCMYITNYFVGHGFMDKYAETADFFQGKELERRPTEVAYKTYDNENDGSWWLRLEIPNPGVNQPGMARVKVNRSANSAAVHARNLTRLRLDLDWMGLEGDAGSTMTFNIDDDTSPNVFSIADTTGAVTLELVDEWTNPSELSISLDGELLDAGTDYTVDGSMLVLPGMPTAGGHTLVVQVPWSLPANRAPNSGIETGASGSPADWSGEVTGGGSAKFLWGDLEYHGGARSLRLKDANLTGLNCRAVWKSDDIAVSGSNQFLLSAMAKARMLKGADIKLGIAWYDYRGDLIREDWSNSLNQGETCNEDWSPLSLLSTSPVNARSARIMAGVSNGSPVQTRGSAWFDDFSLTRYTP